VLRKLSGVNVSARHLRHHFAVQCLTRGIPISVVSAWMGHSKIGLTVKRYGRFTSEAREQWTWAALPARQGPFAACLLLRFNGVRLRRLSGNWYVAPVVLFDGIFWARGGVF